MAATIPSEQKGWIQYLGAPVLMSALQDVIRDLEALDRRAVICAKKPWTPESEALVALPDDDGGIPADVKAAGFVYFLERHVAEEVLEVFEDSQGVALEKRIALLIFYAENDAYPDWVYEGATE